MSRKPKIVVGIAWYRPQDWERLLSISADRDKLEATHAEWVVRANKTVRDIERAGHACERIVVDLDELLAWCHKHNCRVNGDSRSSFVSEKVRG